MNQPIQNIVELSFPVIGDSLPSQHAYPLYSAISRLIPEAHKAAWLGIHTLKGRPTKPGIIQLSRFSVLKLRLPAEQVPTMIKLAGATLDIDGHKIECGIPQIFALKPASNLRSRLVIIKAKDFNGKSADAKTFLLSLNRSLANLGITAIPELETKAFPDEREPFARRVLDIKSTKIAGYGVIFRNLTPDDSIAIQGLGLGGRRRMGCGLFVPIGKGD